MNFRNFFTFSAVSVSLALAACAAPASSDDDAAPASASEDLTARDLLQGSWSTNPAADIFGGLDLRPSGQFFWDKAGQRIEGSWTANKQANTLTTTVGGSETVYRYVHTPAPILNGFPGPHGFPRTFARLELQQLRPMTTVAVTHSLEQVDSFCSSSVDCMLEQQDKTWTPASATGTPACVAHACQMGPARKESVVATCNESKVLNGFIVASEIRKVEISESLPLILNGFAVPSFKVTIKKGDVVEETLDHCTGNLSSWNLHCTPSDGAVGAMRVFELSDKADSKGTFSSGAISPSAPVTSVPFFCTMAE